MRPACGRLRQAPPLTARQRLRAWLSSLSAPQKRQDGEDQEHKEQNLRNARRARGNSTEPEDRCNDRDDEKDDCVVKHFRLPPLAVCGGVVRRIFAQHPS
jgi:hypothetical protein